MSIAKALFNGAELLSFEES